MEKHSQVLLVTRNRHARQALARRVSAIGHEVIDVHSAATAFDLLVGRACNPVKPQFALVIVERDSVEIPAISLVDEMRSGDRTNASPVLIVAQRLTDSDQVAAHRLGHCRVIKHSSDDRVLRAGIGFLTGVR